MDYLHQLCDGCQKPLLPSEDVVVCPECGTPQHRACYEANHACVNAPRHAEGFNWTPDVLPAPQQSGRSGFVCPVCGALNQAGSTECVRCGQQFAAQQPERQSRVESQHADIRSLFPELPQESDDMSMDDEQFEAVCDSVLERAARVAPGMTQAQSQETVAGHPIRQVMTFVASKPLVYINKFRALKTRRFTWNWAAFFFSPYWFFYRKLYKPGVIFLTLQLAVTLLVQPYVLPLSELAYSLQEKAATAADDAAVQALLAQFYKDASPYLLPLLIAAGVILLLRIVCGLCADRLYCNYVQRTLDDVKQSATREEFLVTFLRRGSVSVFALAVSFAIVQFLPDLLEMLF